MLSALKHADDAVLMAAMEEDLQALLDILARWCCKWQLTPQALKCDVMVFDEIMIALVACEYDCTS